MDDGEKIPTEVMDILESELVEQEILFSLKANEYQMEDFHGKIKGQENWMILTKDRTLLVDKNEVIMNADNSMCEAECKKGILFNDNIIFKRTSSLYKIQFEKNKREMVEKAVGIISGKIG